MNCHPPTPSPPPSLHKGSQSVALHIYRARQTDRQTGVYYVIEKNAVLNVIKIKNRALIRRMKYFSTIAAARVK